MTDEERADYRAGKPLMLPTGNGPLRTSADFTVDLASGGKVQKVDPVTMQATGEPQSFRFVEPGRLLKAAELSSQDRNALLDSLVATVNTNAKALAEWRTKHEALQADVTAMNRAWQQVQLQQNARLDAHANVVLRSRWVDRLRWLVTGK